MRSLELFSGAGGLAKGLELAGFNHSAFVEFNKHAYSSLVINFEPEKVFFGDIKDFDYSSAGFVDIVAGGPPCQPFSLGGKHQANQDSRDMFPYAIQAIEKLTPKAFVFENVKGLLRPSFADYFDYIILRLTYPSLTAQPCMAWQEHLEHLRTMNKFHYTGIKYDVKFKLINAADYGVPQTRERVVIVGIRTDLGKSWSFPEPTHSADRLIWDKHVTGDYWKRHNVECPPVASAVKEKALRLRGRFGFFEPDLKPWKTVRDALQGVPGPNEEHEIEDHVFKKGARSYPGHTGSDLDWPSKTIKAGAHGVPGGENMIRYADGSVRYFSIFEAKRIQTFPDSFVIKGAWGEAMRQIGNAVPVLLAEVIGNKLCEILNNEPITTQHFVGLDAAQKIQAAPLIRSGISH
jgi:DNA (cytosine-5)-methyltransferase 1